LLSVLMDLSNEIKSYKRFNLIFNLTKTKRN
jgi:hypothetical protein